MKHWTQYRVNELWYKAAACRDRDVIDVHTDFQRSLSARLIDQSGARYALMFSYALAAKKERRIR